MDSIQGDLAHASSTNPDACIIPVTARPTGTPAVGWQPLACGVLVATQNGDAVRKQVFYKRQRYAMRSFMVDILDNKSNCWERQLYVYDLTTRRQTEQLASEVLHDFFGRDPVSRQALLIHCYFFCGKAQSLTVQLCCAGATSTHHSP
jgi:hypothetical protein